LYGGGLLVAVVADDGNLVAVGQFHHFGALEDDGFTGFKNQTASAGGVHFFDGLHADSRNIKSHVGVFVSDFDKRPAAHFAELAGPVNHGIRALERFNRDDVLVENGNRLANIHFGDGLAGG